MVEILPHIFEMPMREADEGATTTERKFIFRPLRNNEELSIVDDLIEIIFVLQCNVVGFCLLRHNEFHSDFSNVPCICREYYNLRLVRTPISKAYDS